MPMTCWNMAGRLLNRVSCVWFDKVYIQKWRRISPFLLCLHRSVKSLHSRSGLGIRTHLQDTLSISSFSVIYTSRKLSCRSWFCNWRRSVSFRLDKSRKRIAMPNLPGLVQIHSSRIYCRSLTLRSHGTFILLGIEPSVSVVYLATQSRCGVW